MFKNCIHTIKKHNRKNNKKTGFILLGAGKIKANSYIGSPFLFFIEEVQQFLIDHQIQTITSIYPNAEIILVVGHDAEKVINYVTEQHSNIKIVENFDSKNNSSLHSLRSVFNITSSDHNYFIIHADRAFNTRCISSPIKDRSYLYSHKIDKANEYIGLSYDHKKLLNISYGLSNVWSEILFICEKDHQIFKKFINLIYQSKIYSLPELIQATSKHIEYYIDNSKDLDIKLIKDI